MLMRIAIAWNIPQAQNTYNTYGIWWPVVELII